MPPEQTVLLLGGTGRTGRRALQQLLDRGVNVRAIARSAGKLSPDLAGNPNLALIESSLPSLADDELKRHLDGCDAVVSCLGHVVSFRGIFGVRVGDKSADVGRLEVQASRDHQRGGERVEALTRGLAQEVPWEGRKAGSAKTQGSSCRDPSAH